MVYVGRFTTQEMREGIHKKAIEQKEKETGLKYTESKVVYKNKQPIGLDIWVCTAEEFTI